MKTVVLGVSGSVAAYRACDLARELMRRGFQVKVCLTDSAEKFVTRDLFEALTGQPCIQDGFDEPTPGRMAHIDWARQADVLVVAPATANIIDKLAHGIADDMLTTIALAYEGPLVLAPAMNPTMYASQQVQASLATISSRAAVIVEPKVGDVACGENGQGKFASIEEIAEQVELVAARNQKLKGSHVLITAGPTQEPIDSVRFISNRSSGRMGAALARAALLMGAEVTVVCGPTDVPMPIGAQVIRIHTAEEMLREAAVHAGSADLILGVAAVADYRVAHPIEGKIRRSEEPLPLELTPNPDIIAELSKIAKPGAKVVGFAAEPSPELEIAKQKIAKKRLTAIAHNDVSRDDIGFGSETNELTLITADGEEWESGKLSKLACAFWLLERIA